ncbi:unnamed protein product [Brachionus calyciflorus]|uniref:PRA1 family protein n=1 Tax=Brachionus calyciflorus TaxID=104777 RepID=A0A814B9W0_9BILA|nr:unnamed protein product [Brachionus calyciflorus]
MTTQEQTINLENINLEGEIETPAKASANNSSSKIPPKSDSSFNFGMFSSVPSFDALKPTEWVSKRRENLKPWTEFASFSKFKKPNSPTQLGGRLFKNILYFQSNYLFVFIFLAIYCVLTSPFLLFAFMAFAGGLYIVNLKFKEGSLKIFGKEMGMAQLYMGAGFCSLPLFLIAGAGSAVFWIIGASFFVIALHASFYSREEQEDPFMVQMNVV